MRSLWNFLTYWTNLRVRRDRIVADADKREKSVSFGVQSILSSIFGAVVIILCAFGISALMDNDSAVSIVFIALLALLMIVALIQLTLRGLITMIYQLKVNRRAIGWVALAVWLLAVIATVALSILMISKVIGG